MGERGGAEGGMALGDRESFETLVRSCYRAVFAYARRVLGDDAEAADVTQETFVRAWRYRESFDPAQGSQRGWVFRIASNQVREVFAKRKRAPSHGEHPEPVSADPSALEVYAGGVLREDVLRAVEALPVQQREVVALKYLSELSYAEVGQILGVSESAAKMRALRARDGLARRLARYAPREERS